MSSRIGTSTSDWEAFSWITAGSWSSKLQHNKKVELHNNEIRQGSCLTGGGIKPGLARSIICPKLHTRALEACVEFRNSTHSDYSRLQGKSPFSCQGPKNLAKPRCKLHANVVLQKPYGWCGFYLFTLQSIYGRARHELTRAERSFSYPFPSDFC